MTNHPYPIPSWAADRTTGLTPQDVARQLDQLGDDNPGEHPGYNLGHALNGWDTATRGTDRDTVGQLRWAHPDGNTTLNLTGRQHNQLTRMLNVDTAVHLAHQAATREV